MDVLRTRVANLTFVACTSVYPYALGFSRIFLPSVNERDTLQKSIKLHLRTTHMAALRHGRRHCGTTSLAGRTANHTEYYNLWSGKLSDRESYSKYNPLTKSNINEGRQCFRLAS